MPEVPLPEAMGLNENAAISRDTGDSEKLIKGIRLTQPISADTSTAKDVTSVSSSMLRHVSELIQVKINVVKLFTVLIYANPVNWVPCSRRKSVKGPQTLA